MSLLHRIRTIALSKVPHPDVGQWLDDRRDNRIAFRQVDREINHPDEVFQEQIVEAMAQGKIALEAKPATPVAKARPTLTCHGQRKDGSRCGSKVLVTGSLRCRHHPLK